LELVVLEGKRVAQTAELLLSAHFPLWVAAAALVLLAAEGLWGKTVLAAAEAGFLAAHPVAAEEAWVPRQCLLLIHRIRERDQSVLRGLVRSLRM
jgi:hypothetical protein